MENVLHIKNNSQVSSICTQTQIADAIVLEYPQDLAIIKTISAHMHTAHIPIIVITEEKNVAQSLAYGADDCLVPPIDHIMLQQKIHVAIQRAKKYTALNPLTQLPGNTCVKKVIQARLLQSIAILYLDIDNFKQYNDTFGFYDGDTVIIKTAHIIRKAVTLYGNSSDFVGHLGGDDFFIISTPKKTTILSHHIQNMFYNTITKRYNHMSLSIAILDNNKEQITNLQEISRMSAKYKRFVKERKSL
jgi:diguanylate cyclase (GGDEF)-like protein